jgi:hypothetical protein
MIDSGSGVNNGCLCLFSEGKTIKVLEVNARTKKYPNCPVNLKK